MPASTTVLVAEDDPDFRRIVTRLLERSGYEVLVAEDGAQALALISPRVQVGLIDWMMPGVDGVEVCRRLKEATEGRAQAIMVTAMAEKADIVRALDEGADDYITKPVDHGELLARVRAAERASVRERDLAAAWLEARSQADRDVLTGLFTRRVCDDALAELTSASPRPPIAVLLLDIDHFKRVNDTCGHPAGDEVLRAVAESIRSQTRRTSEIAVRYGGEEFAVIAPGMALDGACALAERIRQQIASMRLLMAGRVLQVTVSAGVALLEPHETHAEPVRVLIERADARLYAAKHAGRNRVAA
ncbi:MAG TPA: diguanylate cyclase response regulator [Armatimonadetes bacterium]|mgnify:CR=1 FL=1|nr:diguanylate cyclase response regulator [Armatimonadota bacterium]